jgi:DNA-binding beta-propeller fold protein YncE
LPEEYKVGAHPESFQVEQSGPNIYVNVPDLKQIVAVNRKSGAITRWPVPMAANFPMALDEPDHRVFVATRSPARMAVFDTATGKLVTALPCVQDSDDIYYDSARKRIYASGGEGFISVFKQVDANQYELVAKIPSAVGARTSAYSGKVGKKGFDRLYVAVPARAERGAEVLIYTVQ